MVQSKLIVNVRRIDERLSVIDIEGDVTGQGDALMSDAFSRATAHHPRCVALNFSKLDYMNSSGIGILVTLLVRAQRQKLKLITFGLNVHYREIFELTRLDDAIGIFDNEADALAGATTQ